MGPAPENYAYHAGVSLYVLHFRSGSRSAYGDAAVEAGVSDHVWSVEEIVGLLR